MNNRNSKYGPQNFEGIISQQEKSYDAPLSSLHDDFEDLRLEKEIFDKKKELTALASDLENRLNAISSKCDLQIKKFGDIVTRQERVAEKIMEMGRYVDEMLEESKAYKDKGIGLADGADEQVQKYMDDFSLKLKGTIDKEMIAFNSRMTAIEISHGKVQMELEKKYNEGIKILEASQGKLLTQVIAQNNRIYFPGFAFLVLIAISVSIIVTGWICWMKFWKVTGNETMVLMAIAVVTELIYIIAMGWNSLIYREEKDDKVEKNKKNTEEETKVYSMSLSQALYSMILTMAAGVYVVWNAFGGGTSPEWMIYLMPGAQVINIFWMIIGMLIARIDILR